MWKTVDAVLQRFAHHLGIAKHQLSFRAIDGLHEAKIEEINSRTFSVELQMIDVKEIRAVDNQTFTTNTGSPHYVHFTEKPIVQLDMRALGKQVRYSSDYKQEGINVNYVNAHTDSLQMRTYERGVEDETLSCGTGVTAAALSWHHAQKSKLAGKHKTHVLVAGGALDVKFHFCANFGYTQIWLCGPAVSVFDGQIEV